MVKTTRASRVVPEGRGARHSDVGELPRFDRGRTGGVTAGGGAHRKPLAPISHNRRSVILSRRVSFPSPKANRVPILATGTACVASLWKPEVKERLARVVSSTPVALLMFAATLYGLFAPDVRLAAFPASADNAFSSMALVVVSLFLVEVAARCVVQPGYAFTFNFWLDIVSALSLLPDVQWLWDGMFRSSTSAQSIAVVRAARASRVGTRAGRVVRLLRLVRLLSIVFKDYERRRTAQQRLRNHTPGKRENTVRRSIGSTRKGDASSLHLVQEVNESRLKRTHSNAAVAGGKPAVTMQEPSDLAKAMADLTTRRVILLVVLVVLLLPVFQASLYVEKVTMDSNALETVHRYSFLRDPALFDEYFRRYVTSSSGLVHISVQGVSDAEVKALLAAADGFDHSDYHELGDVDTVFRDAEVVDIEVSGCFLTDGSRDLYTTRTCTTTAVWSQRPLVRFRATLSVLKTLYILIILCGGALMFMHDTEELVTRPIERVVHMVRALAERPDDSLVALTKSANDNLNHIGDARKGEETYFIEKSLRKIGGLLQIGFGTAGCAIIARVLKDSEVLDPSGGGSRVTGVFGFCSIRNFMDITECLQEELMVFVNRVAAIVHFATNKFAGAANKNIGEAFLVVWRLTDKDKRAVLNDRQTTHIDTEDALDTQLADNALLSFLKIITDLEDSSSSGELHTYEKYGRLMDRFPGGFKVSMGFGLHYGWAIEGAIGSRYKIDASYLSPNVNIASRLEAATKQYNVKLLLSSSLYSRLSESAAANCRRVDKVAVKGSKIPLELYTYDITNYPSKFICPCRNPRHFQDADFDTDTSISKLQSGLHPDFASMYEVGLHSYLGGRWEQARPAFEAAASLKEGDGPTATLLAFMATHDYVAPATWPGFRELTEK